jgi:hypothetical protein
MSVETAQHPLVSNVPTRPDVLTTLGFVEKCKAYQERIEAIWLDACASKGYELHKYVVVYEQVAGDPFKYMMWLVPERCVTDVREARGVSRAAFNRLDCPSIFVDLTPHMTGEKDIVMTQADQKVGAQYTKPNHKQKGKIF